ncbi:FR47-like protein [Paenibacillus sp. yr247]|uniref:GNAT family N-acetyltransferase n=1 Tax=Paenibacillus sp. yr247 TaxID=1761880 RepID=UPI0008809D30|nr:GNAT family N-acetyltransferase [Paenibacillus sp. yr247]SDO22087.1 FR47-like protein [Paenibacillus sp. yr247]
MIKLIKYDDLTLFKKDVISFLEQYEAENNLVLGVLQSLNEKNESPLFMAAILKDNDLGLVLLQTHPSQIILSKSISFSSKEIHVIGEELKNTIQEIPCAIRPTQNNITISYVYTPISERKKGYASDCVSVFTQFLLDRGYKTISLYTDLSNPTSNKIYIQIGYEAIMDSVVILIK